MLSLRNHSDCDLAFWQGVSLVAPMFHPVAIFAALSLCATAVLAVDVTGIVAPEQLNTTQPASSGSTCSVVLQPFTIYSPTFNSTLPTASPVPPYVLASLSFAVYNQGSEAISAPWNLQLSSSHYQAVLQVRPPSMSVPVRSVLQPVRRCC